MHLVPGRRNNVHHLSGGRKHSNNCVPACMPLNPRHQVPPHKGQPAEVKGNTLIQGNAIHLNTRQWCTVVGSVPPADLA